MSLQVVRRRVEIDAPLAAVLSLTLDAQRYPEFAPSIDTATLMSHDAASQKYMIRYETMIPVINKSTASEQEVHYDLVGTMFNFRETKGTFGRFEGYRRLVLIGKNLTAIESEVRYSFGGNKLIAAMVNKVSESLVRSNLESIQEGIKRIAEAGGAEPLTTVLDKLGVSHKILAQVPALQ